MAGEFLVSYRTLKRYNGDSEEVHIPENIEKIDENAFLGNKSVKRIYLPRSLLLVEDYAFADCSNLRELVLPRFNTLFGPEFKQLAFYWSNIRTIVLSKYVFAVQRNIKDMLMQFTGKYIENIFVEPENKKLLDINGNVFSKDKTKFIAYARGKKETKYDIPNGVMSIGDKAFASSKLQSVTIPSTVKEIKEEAFVNCKELKEIYIPTSVEKIGITAFDECKSLKQILLPEEFRKNKDFVMSLPYEAEFY